MTPMISAAALSRRYRDQVALDSVWLTVLAAVAVLLGLGGFTTMRRVTI